MATNRIKGITIDIGGNTTQLTKALDDVDKSLKDTQGQLKDVNKLLKLDPSNVELLRQKQDLLGDAIKSTKARQQELIKALDQAKNAGDTAENRKQQDALQRELIETEQNLKKLEAEMVESGKATSEAGASMDKAQKSAGAFGDVLKAKLTGDAVVAGVKRLSKELKSLAFDTINLSDDLATQASITGLSTDALQEYAYMAELVDVSVDTITGSLTKLTRNMKTASKGSGDAYNAFKRLGVSFQDASGALRDNEAVFNDVIDALGDIQNETERDSIAMALFGKSAQDLNPLIKTGGDQLAKYAAEAHEVGYVMSREVIDGNVKASDAIQRLKNSVTAAKNELGSALAPAIATASDKLAGLVKWSRENSDTLKKLGSVIATAGAAFVAYKVAVAAIELPSKAAAAAQALLNTTMAANPVALVTVALAGLFVALDTLSKKSYSVGKDVKELTGRLDTLSQEMSQNTSEWDTLTAAEQRNISATASEYSHYEDLLKELGGIVDQNGKVKKGYEDRAKVITGILSQALGTEIQLTDGVIKNYKTLEQKLKDVILQKKAELILKAQEEAYTKALQTRQTASLQLAQADKARNEAAQAASKKTAELAKLEAEKAELAKWGYSDYTSVYMKDLDARIEAKKKEISEITTSQNKLDAEYQEARRVVDDTTYDIMVYEKNLAAVTNGEYDKIIQANSSTARSYKDLNKEGKKAIDALTGSTAGMGSELYEDAKKAGEDFMNGFKKGIENKKPELKTAVSGVGTSSKQWLKTSLVENSPSKATEEMGEYFVEGLAVGIKNEQADLFRQIFDFGRATLAAFQGSTAGGFDLSAGLSGGAGAAAGQTVMAAATPAATVNAPVSVSVVVNGNVDNYDELAQTIGEKLQQQMARQGRAFA